VRASRESTLASGKDDSPGKDRWTGHLSTGMNPGRGPAHFYHLLNLL
jgi:hypothetical protein